MTRLRRVTTAELSNAELEALRRLVFGAFGGRFDEHDWDHTLGGVHVLAEEDVGVVAHGAVVPRTLVAGVRSTRMLPSSSAVRSGPSGAATQVGPCQVSHPSRW